MKKLIDLSNEEARKHFLKGTSYFNAKTLGTLKDFGDVVEDFGDVVAHYAKLFYRQE